MLYTGLSYNVTTIDEIFRRRKHIGHTGGLDGCPLCERPSNLPQEEDLVDVPLDELIAAESPTQPEPVDPMKSRIASIVGRKP